MTKGFADDLFAHKSVVVTGAGRGIGLAVTRAFLATGARVIAHSGRGPFAEDHADIADGLQRGRLVTCEADFATLEGQRRFLSFVEKEADVVDVLINNAGTMLGRIPAAELTDAQYGAITTLNQTSVVNMTRGLLPRLRAANGASIVNTVSISARTGGSPGSAIYSAAKAFVATYTKALARELAPEGIRANAVSPGTITTAFHDRYSSPEKLEATRKTVPLGRLGTAEDCAPAFLFLASGSLSGYITGQVIEVNGGQLMA